MIKQCKSWGHISEKFSQRYTKEHMKGCASQPYLIEEDNLKDHQWTGAWLICDESIPYRCEETIHLNRIESM